MAIKSLLAILSRTVYCRSIFLTDKDNDIKGATLLSVQVKHIGRDVDTRTARQ